MASEDLKSKNLTKKRSSQSMQPAFGNLRAQRTHLYRRILVCSVGLSEPPRVIFIASPISNQLKRETLRVTMFEQAFKNIDDVLWKEAGCTTELDYTEQASWLLFLKYLDDLEQDKSSEAALEGRTYTAL
jgi:hypothetical protein